MKRIANHIHEYLYGFKRDWIFSQAKLIRPLTINKHHLQIHKLVEEPQPRCNNNAAVINQMSHTPAVQ